MEAIIVQRQRRRCRMLVHFVLQLPLGFIGSSLMRRVLQLQLLLIDAQSNPKQGRSSWRRRITLVIECTWGTCAMAWRSDLRVSCRTSWPPTLTLPLLMS